MNIDALSIKLAELMEYETELLNKISEEEENLQKALRNNSWQDMEKIISRLGPLSDSMEKTEEQRNRVFQKLKTKLKKNEGDSFYSVAMNMKEAYRDSCLSGYRRMKIALLRMQGITSGINHYVRTVGETSRAVLEEVFPHRKGRIYSNNGVEKPLSSDPLILNRHL